jgi:hypothetical protein
MPEKVWQEYRTNYIMSAYMKHKHNVKKLLEAVKIGTKARSHLVNPADLDHGA